MRSTLFCIILTFIVSMLQNGCVKRKKPINRQAEIEEISRVIDSCIGWFKTKDFELSFSTVAKDSNFLEVHPTARVVRGFEQFKKNSEIIKNPDFLYSRHEIKIICTK